jgi:hypothetical protein
MADGGSKGKCSSRFSGKIVCSSELVSCEKCKEYSFLLKEARDELYSMQIINELLQKELSTHVAPHYTVENELPNEHRSTIKKSYSEVVATGGKRNPAISSYTEKKKTTTSPARAAHQTNVPTPFTTGLNSNGILTDKKNARKNLDWTSSKSPRGKHFNIPHEGNKIPMVINGRIMHVQSMKPASTLMNFSRATTHRNNRPIYKVKITGIVTSRD